jgi:hypothetical protein
MRMLWHLPLLYYMSFDLLLTTLHVARTSACLQGLGERGLHAHAVAPQLRRLHAS